jgi:cytochrome c-type biogenesis protein CcmF
VAASSAFPDQRDVRLSPGQTSKVGDYTVTYREPTTGVLEDRSGTGAPITFGAVLDVRKGDKRFVLRPSRNFYESREAGAGPIARFFEGEATSEVDVRWGLRRDFWAAVRPDVAALERVTRALDRRIERPTAEQQLRAVSALSEIYRREPPAAAFRFIVSPLVAWIWIGGAIALLGALVAAWPSPEARLRRVSSLYAGRLGRELSRA